MGFLLVGTYWPWSQREQGGSGEAPAAWERTAAPASNERIRAVVRGHDGRIHKLTEVPPMNAQGPASSRVSFGIKVKTGRGTSLLFPSVTVSIHL